VKLFRRILAAPLPVISIALLLFAGVSFAQESSSNPSGLAGTAGPVATLRDLLMAACSQSQNDFSRFLTARNKASFLRLAPAARIAFMKRFVLLNEAGKPSATVNPSGRPIVRCDTPAGAAEIQVGGADIGDNVAFMPVNLRDATDSVGSSAIQVNIGMVRENGEWKILSLGLVLLDLPSLELEWDSAEADKNEAAAIELLKQLAGAVEAYRRKYTRLPDALANLGPAAGGVVGANSAGLIDADLASGIKNGYSFRYVIVGASTTGAPAKFQLSATPASYGRTGHRSFFRDSEGTLRGADRQGAVGSASDPKLPES
jgi:hypothetical protein